MSSSQATSAVASVSTSASAAHAHLAGGAGWHVHIVKAHGEIGNCPNARTLIQELACDAVGHLGQESVAALGRRQQFIR